jgi:hypothetical protein
VTKAHVATEGADQGGTQSPDLASKAAGEESSAAEQPSGEDEDVFKEIPTVANRANPTTAPSNGNAAPSSQPDSHESVGTYRIVHPATSDSIAPPATTKSDSGTGKRMILGSARKPRE